LEDDECYQLQQKIEELRIRSSPLNNIDPKLLDSWKLRRETNKKWNPSLNPVDLLTGGTILTNEEAEEIIKQFEEFLAEFEQDIQEFLSR